MYTFNLELFDLIERGYFPRELPPQFNTGLYAQALLNSWPDYSSVFSARQVSKPAQHSIPRSGRLRRNLSIPNPINYFQICNAICYNKNLLIEAISRDPYSLTRPVVDDEGERAIRPQKWFDDIPRIRAEKRSRARYMLRADVSRFYSSIYSHSVPWALHGKSVAKRDRSDALFGNRLDVLLRNSQDGQTVGIPIGPDASLVVAELILSQVDEEFIQRTGFDGFRFVDDYEIYCDSMSDVEVAISALESSMNSYELQLNPRKVQVIELPESVDSSWASELRTMQIRSSSDQSQYYDLLKYLDKTTEYIKKHKDDGVLKYCLSRLARIDILGDNQEFVFDYVLQCFVVDPSTAKIVIPIICDRFCENRGVLSPSRKAKLRFATIEVLLKSMAYSHLSEAAWALWVCIVFSIRIPEEVFTELLSSTDSILILSALDAHEKGLVDGQHSLAPWESMINNAGLYDDTWLLVYESLYKGWLSRAQRSIITSSRHFQLFTRDNVSFYNSDEDPVDMVPNLPPTIRYHGFGGGGGGDYPF